jgi:hypothetical protein
MIPVHFLFSVYITDKRLTPVGYYKETGPTNKLDQLVTSLTTISKLTPYSADIRIKLDDSYKAQAPSIETLVHNLYSEKLSYSQHRLEKFNDWQAAISLIPSETEWILLSNNHDHAYINESVNEWHDFIEILTESDYQIAHISHWTEALGWSRIRVGHLSYIGRHLYYNDSTTIGTILIRKTFFQNCFNSDFTLGSLFVRPDNPFGPTLRFKQTQVLIPDTEFFRHLDGYGHVGLVDTYSSSLRSSSEFIQGRNLVFPWSYGLDPFETKKTDLLRLPRVYSDARNENNSCGPNLLYLSTRYRFRFRVVVYFIRKYRLLSRANIMLTLRILTLPATLMSLIRPATNSINSIFVKVLRVLK